MTKQKKVCFVTGTRAEYGLLSPLMKKVKQDQSLNLQVIATGAHLSPEFGNTYTFIEEDGIEIDEKIETLVSSDSAIGVSKSMGLGMISLSEAYQRLQPDLIVLLGDRYESFIAAAAAMVANIPIAHLHGGETTEGAFDEAFRHSISKMSQLHFASTEEYRKRLIQLGEQPETVNNVGAIGIDNIVNLKLMKKEELEKSLNFTFKDKLVLVTFHPVTFEKATSRVQFEQLVAALDKMQDASIIFTKANADNDGRIINQIIDEYVQEHVDSSIAFTSMGQVRYLSAMEYADLVIGNSSSGIIEAPSFNVPTINIGDRQKGRIQAESVINSLPESKAISAAIDKAFSQSFIDNIKKMHNPYGQGNTCQKVIDKIKGYLDSEQSLKKVFYDVEVPDV